MGHDTNYQDREFKIIGTRVKRPDGIDKVTGRAKYGADAFAPGQLVGKVLRSPHAHAIIQKIDISKAEKLAGVKAIITSADLPDLTGTNRGMTDILENCMARGRALYHGHAVAAVAAIDEQTAKQALKLIKVTYKLLPHVTDVDEAMLPDAPIIQDFVLQDGKPSNIAGISTFGHGDVDAGFAEADVIVEKSYKTEQTHQGYIEPHACLANVSSDGSGELWVTTQGHFSFRVGCSTLLGLDMAKLKVTSSEIGGGFGGKTHVWTEPLALALSRKANRPVKLVMTRDEVFKASGPTSSTSMDIKIGAKKDGTITAATAMLRYQDGAFPGIWGMLGAMTAYACYDLKNVKTVGHDVLVNRPKVAAYRAPSAPMAAFGVESTMDLVANEIGMSPVRTSDGFVMICIVSGKNMRRLCEAINRTDILQDERFAAGGHLKNTAAFVAEIEIWSKSLSAQECELALNKFGVPCSLYNSPEDLFDHPQVVSRQAFTEQEDEYGAFLIQNAPFKLANIDISTSGHSPKLGQHTDEVLAQVLKFSATEIARLRSEGIID
ncbi:molybdopterin-dependent oxidoreductase [Pseudomonadales bacterium]|nr:molybdopterin-dependent oxidoreductase [Pseudomonadales bacterium]